VADPFETLGVEARFDLDLGALERRHRDLSKTLHPDRYVNATAAERRMALGRAIDVNAAYRMVKDPVKRAEALAARAGLEMSETSEPKASPGLLMEMMEAREELSEAAADQKIERVTELGERMRAREASIVGELGKGFGAAAGDREQVRALLPKLGELRYVRRFIDEASAIEERLSP
jgi:molecular chaperone HscB